MRLCGQKTQRLSTVFIWHPLYNAVFGIYAVLPYENVWKWLAERSCAALVSPQLIERYAMASARWIQCESITSELGFLAKHPTTGAAIQSPYVAIADKYMTQANRLWSEIYQIVRENCTGEYGGANPQDDVMERLLRARKGTM